MSPTVNDAERDARNWFRHEVSAQVFFMTTSEEKPLDSSVPHLEGKLIDVSEKGFRFESPIHLETDQQISFEITSNQKAIFSGVGKAVHCEDDLKCGVSYIKIRKHS